MIERKSGLWKHAIRNPNDSSKSSHNDSFSSAKSQSNSFTKFQSQKPPISPKNSFFARNSQMDNIFSNKKSFKNDNPSQTKPESYKYDFVLAAVDGQNTKKQIDKSKYEKIMKQIKIYKKLIKQMSQYFKLKFKQLNRDLQKSVNQTIQIQFHIQNKKIQELKETILLKQSQIHKLLIKNQNLQKKLKQFESKLESIYENDNKIQYKKIGQIKMKQYSYYKPKQIFKEEQQRVTLSTIKDGNQSRAIKTLKKASLNLDLGVQNSMTQILCLKQNIKQLKKLIQK